MIYTANLKIPSLANIAGENVKTKLVVFTLLFHVMSTLVIGGNIHVHVILIVRVVASSSNITVHIPQLWQFVTAGCCCCCWCMDC